MVKKSLLYRPIINVTFFFFQHLLSITSISYEKGWEQVVFLEVGIDKGKRWYAMQKKKKKTVHPISIF